MDLKRALIHELANKVSILKSMAEVKGNCMDKNFLFTLDNIDLLVRYLLDVEISEVYEKKNLKRLSLKDIMDDVISELNLFLKLKGVSVKLEECPSAEIVTDEFLLKRILYNLLHNAVKFSPEGGIVLVRCELSKGRMILSIHNEVGEYGEYDNKGSGIGLSVTRELASHINAEVVFHTEDSRAKAEVLLPIN